MFKTLNRLMKLAVVLAWAGAAFLLWTQRERGRPLLDLYLVWKESGYQSPEPLPRVRGDVTRVLAENRIILRGTNGLGYELILAGVPTMSGNSPDRFKIVLQQRTNLAAQVVGRSAEFAYTLMQPARVGIGFLYVETNSVSLNVEMAEAGKARLSDQVIRLLPLREQAAFRAAVRRRSMDSPAAALTGL
jgi:hypothetical protein